MFDTNIKYHVFKDYNINVDETASSYISVRKAQWVKENASPDENKAKIEIRKIAVNSSGEQALRGVSFNSEKAVGDLTVGLIGAGFGETRDIILSVAKRKDFKSTIENIDKDPDDDSTGELFDMRSLLLGIDNTEEE